ncbi:lysophospholipid acyltransferase family protein, partial [bacterium]|nr:lysophospholipid acyltransferase family protein [candidate division CSSED10-310 bacterium]
QILPIPMAGALGRCLGGLRHLIDHRGRELRATELANLLFKPPASPMADIIARSYRLDNERLLQSFLYPRLDKSSAARLFRYEGLDILDRTLAAGTGGIILLAHYGANQFSIPALGFRGYPINQLGSIPKDWNRLNQIEASPLQQRIFDLRLSFEKELPVTFVYLAGSMRPIFECLRRNELIIFAFDGRAGSKWLDIPVLRRTMRVSTGPFSLARQTGTPVIPLFMIAGGNGVHTCRIETPYFIAKTADREADLHTGALTFASLLGSYIEARPDHYAGLLMEAKKRATVDPTPLFTDYPGTQCRPKPGTPEAVQ